MSEIAPSETFAGETGAAVAPIRIEQIQLDLLAPDPEQPRKHFDPDALQSLAESIKARGLIQPIIARPLTAEERKATSAITPRPYKIIAGERRYRAAKLAGIIDVPVIVRDDLAGQDLTVMQVLENLQREDLTLAETAAGVARLVQELGAQETARQLGKSEAWISKHAGVSRLPEAVQRLVAAEAVQSADIAHDLGELYAINKQTAERKISEFESANKKDAWTRPPTREQLRQSLKQAKDSQAYKEKQKQEQQKLREKAKKDPGIAKQLAEAKRKKDSREGIKARLEAAQKYCKDFADEMTARLCALAGIKPAKNGYRYDAPLIVTPPSLYSLDREPPKTAEAGTYSINSCGTFATVQKAARILLPEAKLDPQIQGEVTLIEAAKLAELLGSRVSFRFNVDRPGAKIKALVEHAMHQQKQPSPVGRGSAAKHIDSATKGAAQSIATNISAFLEARTAKGNPGHRMKADDLYQAYAQYCTDTHALGEQVPMNDNRWGEAIAAAGISKIRSNGIRYVGIKLVAGAPAGSAA